MQFIITEHAYWNVNVCIFKGMMNPDKAGCLINHLCNPEEIEVFRECQWKELQILSWIEWIKSWDSRKTYSKLKDKLKEERDLCLGNLRLS